MDWAWSEFEANKKGFPKGMKHTATKIRKEHPNIEHIAVWHALVSDTLCKRYETLIQIAAWLLGGRFTQGKDRKDLQNEDSG